MMSMPVPGITQMGGNPQYPNFGVQTGMPQGGQGMGQVPPWFMNNPAFQPGGQLYDFFPGFGGPRQAPSPGMQMPGMGGMERGSVGPMERGRSGRMSGFQGPRPMPPQGGMQSMPIPGMQAPQQNPMMQMPMPQYGRYGGG